MEEERRQKTLPPFSTPAELDIDIPCTPPLQSNEATTSTLLNELCGMKEQVLEGKSGDLNDERWVRNMRTGGTIDLAAKVQHPPFHSIALLGATNAIVRSHLGFLLPRPHFVKFNAPEII